MERPPQFIKEFSKEESPEERQEAAHAIRAKRAEHFALRDVQRERLGELLQTTAEREQDLAEQLETLANLENEIFELSNSRLGKILNYFQLRKRRADILLGQKSYEELKELQGAEVDEQQGISEKLESNELTPEQEEARAMLHTFYEQQKEKWANSEYTKEDITKHFSEENLASLSIDDYVLLLKRFPYEMVTHVTRQGVRDHIGHLYHLAGAGEYHTSFMKMLEDGRLRAPLAVCMIEQEKVQAIAKVLGLKELASREEAFNSLQDLVDPTRQGAPASYADRMSVHFATEEVANAYYGAEKGNEIFIAYPSAFIASQYYFNGKLNDTSDRGNGNDQWVWAHEDRGMDLNAGLIFIPDQAKVDRNTGSRYELDEKSRPIINRELIDSIMTVIESPAYIDFATQYDNEARVQQRENYRELFRAQLESQYGITDSRVKEALLDYTFFDYVALIQKQGGQKEDLEKEIQRALQKQGILYREANDPVTSKEFWEEYFANNPDKRPSKIVYYEDGDPTRALLRWREQQGFMGRAKTKENIIGWPKESSDVDIGFPERRVLRDSPEATLGIDRFRALAEKIIENHFAQAETSSH